MEKKTRAEVRLTILPLSRERRKDLNFGLAAPMRAARRSAAAC